MEANLLDPSSEVDSIIILILSHGEDRSPF